MTHGKTLATDDHTCLVGYTIFLVESIPENYKFKLETVKQRYRYEPRYEKSGLRGFRPGPTQTGLYSNRKRLEA